MYILGINTGLGASVCLLKDGKVEFAIEDERITKKKNFGGFPKASLDYLKKHYNSQLSKLDYLCICDNQDVTVTIDEMISRFAFRFIKKPKNILNNTKNILKTLLPKNILDIRKKKQFKVPLLERIKSELSELDFNKIKVMRLQHHLCHASAAYYGLAKNVNKKYLILTLDGGGDGECGSINIGHKGHIKKVLSINSKNSLAALYSSVTYLMGFKPHEHEYKIMGLAPYTSKLYSDEIKQIFYSFLDLEENKGLNFVNKSKERKHPGYELFYKLRLKRFDNIAFAIQDFTEELTIKWIRRAVKKFKIYDILLSGGLFMNIKINKLISELPEINSIDVFPSCGDETNSLGISFFCHSNHSKREVSLLENFNLGPKLEFDKNKIPKKLKKQFKFKYIKTNKYKVFAKLLAKGEIIGNLEGKMEFGARALGNRSLIADPINSDVVEKINYLIKKRDFWMPFAPAILSEDAPKYISIPKTIKNGSPYMMFGFDSKIKQQKNMIAGLHKVDKTARAQIVDKIKYPNFHKLLLEFKKLTGRSVLLNTSFNLHGDPLALDENDAFKVLENSELKYIFLNNYLIERI